jgi:thioredoxin-dependent peroxiredoxin
MKKILYSLVALFCLTAHQSSAADMPQAGMIAPSFILRSQDGKNVSLSDYRGKWVVLYFYPKDFTKGCSLEAHKFQEDIAKYHARDAVIIGVSVDSVDSHKSFCTKQGLDFKLLSDTKYVVSETYGSIMKHGEETLSARNTFLIDPKGIIRKAYAAVSPAGHSSEVLETLDRLQQ